MIAGGKYCKTIDEILDHLLNSLMIYYVVLEFRKAEQCFQCSLGMFWTCNVHIIKIDLLGMFTNLQASMLTRDQLKTQPEGELKTTEWWSQLWLWLLPIKMVYILLWCSSTLNEDHECHHDHDRDHRRQNWFDNGFLHFLVLIILLLSSNSDLHVTENKQHWIECIWGF